MTSRRESKLIFLALSIIVLAIVGTVLWVEEGWLVALIATLVMAIWLAAWFGLEQLFRSSWPERKLGAFLGVTFIATVIPLITGAEWHRALLNGVITAVVILPLTPLFNWLDRLFGDEKSTSTKNR